MNRNAIIMIIAVVILMTTLLPACSGTTSTVTQKPIDVVSVWGPLSPVNRVDRL
jgi:hypothetical protein